MQKKIEDLLNLLTDEEKIGARLDHKMSQTISSSVVHHSLGPGTDLF